MRTQSLLFAAFVQVALGWLEEKDFRKLHRDMISLGLRHRNYGIEPLGHAIHAVYFYHRYHEIREYKR